MNNIKSILENSGLGIDSETRIKGVKYLHIEYGKTSIPVAEKDVNLSTTDAIKQEIKNRELAEKFAFNVMTTCDAFKISSSNFKPRQSNDFRIIVTIDTYNTVQFNFKTLMSTIILMSMDINSTTIPLGSGLETYDELRVKEYLKVFGYGEY